MKSKRVIGPTVGKTLFTLYICIYIYIYIYIYTGLFEMIVGVLTTCHTQYTWDRSICIFLFNRTTLHVFVTYLIGALYVHPLWFYESEPPLKPSPLTCYRYFGKNSIILLIFVKSQRVHIYSTFKVRNKNLEWCSIKLKKTHILISQVYCVWQVVKTPTIISNNPVYIF